MNSLCSVEEEIFCQVKMEEGFGIRENIPLFQRKAKETWHCCFNRISGKRLKSLHFLCQKKSPDFTSVPLKDCNNADMTRIRVIPASQQPLEAETIARSTDLSLLSGTRNSIKSTT